MFENQEPIDHIMKNYKMPFFLHSPSIHPYHEYVSTYHAHAAMYEIYLFLDGDVSYYIDGSRYNLKKGDLLAIMPGTVHKAFIHSTDSYKRLILSINESMLPLLSSEETDLSSELRSHANQLFHLPESELSYLTNLSDLMYELFKKKYTWKPTASFGDDLLLTSYLTIYLVHICNALRQELPFRPRPLDGSVEQVAKYIDTHLTEDLSLPKIAEAVHMSKSGMCQKFRAYYKTSPGEYITTKRLALSQKYLLEGKSISDSCYLAGFHDYTHYLKTFKKKCGGTPKEYRKAWADFPS